MATDLDLSERLQRIEALLSSLLEQRTVKEWYTTAEVAKILGRSEYTVRECCRLGRIHASKRQYARGAYPEWRISHEELTRSRTKDCCPSACTARDGKSRKHVGDRVLLLAGDEVEVTTMRFFAEVSDPLLEHALIHSIRRTDADE